MPIPRAQRSITKYAATDNNWWKPIGREPSSKAANPSRYYRSERHFEAVDKNRLFEECLQTFDEMYFGGEKKWLEWTVRLQREEEARKSLLKDEKWCV